jgi:DnaB-like helicase N terminal domain
MYARMVLEASVRRMLTDHADRLSANAASLGYVTRRLVRAAGEPGFEAENLSLHMGKVASAMRYHAAAFDPATAPVINGPARPADLGDLLHSREFWTMASAAWANAATCLAARYSCEQAEERVLTALLQGHPDSNQVLNTLSAAEFTDAGRRHIFTTVRELLRRDHPVDPLIVDWEIARQEAEGPSLMPEACRIQARSIRDSYVTYLARTTIQVDRPLSVCTDSMLGNRYRIRDFRPRGLGPGAPGPVNPVPIMSPKPEDRPGPEAPQPRP